MFNDETSPEAEALKKRVGNKLFEYKLPQ